MDEQPYLTPTNSFVGVASEFKCYPTTIQELQFEQGGSGERVRANPGQLWQLQVMHARLTLPNHCSCAGVHRVLGTRTLEGLLIELDVHIEYRIVPEEARQVLCVTCSLSCCPPDSGTTHTRSVTAAVAATAAL